MKTTIKQRIKRAIKSIVGIIMFSLTVSIAVNAQGIPGPPGFPTTPTDAPIDGGLSLLAAAGGAYAIKKLRDKNK
ncbi:MAG: hypothetical protein JJ966_01625 [Balneolaceae bacterium]|nr:hypothetical protein [Balneolaceae bacterium]